jgi:hypothetical protein
LLATVLAVIGYGLISYLVRRQRDRRAVAGARPVRRRDGRVMPAVFSRQSDDRRGAGTRPRAQRKLGVASSSPRSDDAAGACVLLGAIGGAGASCSTTCVELDALIALRQKSKMSIPCKIDVIGIA